MENKNIDISKNINNKTAPKASAMPEQPEQQYPAYSAEEACPVIKFNKTLISMIISAVIMGAVLAGAGVYFWQNSGPNNQQAIDNLNAENMELQEQISILQTELDQLKNQPQDETADWETYRNEEHGFEIQHPSEARVIENSSSQIIGLVDETGGYNPSTGYAIKVEILNNTEDLTLEDWITANIKTTIQSQKEIEINKITAIQIDLWAGDSTNRNNFISKNNNIFNIRFDLYPRENDVNSDLHEQIYNKMLNTFQFTQP